MRWRKQVSVLRRRCPASRPRSWRDGGSATRWSRYTLRNTRSAAFGKPCYWQRGG